MHSSVRMASPCEFINVTPLNPLISKCQIKVCYVGEDPNRNGSVITKEVATQMANSLPGCPIVGFFNEESADFEEHNRELEIKNGEIKFVDTTKPYGFVDLNAKCWFQKFMDDGVNEHEYLMTEGYLWTGQYPEAERIIQLGNNQSMELDPDTLNAQWSKNNKGEPEFFIINEGVISKLCILGEDFEPCFEGANITNLQFSFEDSFKQELFSMVKELKDLLEENKGGTQVFTEDSEKLENSLSNEELVEEEANFKKKDEKEEDKKDKSEEANSDNKTEDSKDKADDSKEDTSKAPAKEEAPAKEDTSKAPAKEDTKEEDTGATKEDTKEDEDKKKKDKKKYVLEEIPEYVELSTNYAALESKYNALVAEKTNLEAELTPLKEFKATAERKEKKDMIDSFYMLSEEDKKDVISNIDTYSLHDIEAQLSIICVRNKVSFSLDDDNEGKQGNTTFNLNSGNLDSISTPAWVKAAMDVAEEMK